METGDFQKYMNIKMPEVAENVIEKLKRKPEISKIDYKNANDIIENEHLWNEIGFVKQDNNEYLVAMNTKLPFTNSKMIEWWFWWHVQENERYQIWFPGDHFANSYNKKQKAYFTNQYKGFIENTQYPKERVGKKTAELSIEFIAPKKFGIRNYEKVINENGVIVCGNVGILKGLIQHTKMMHYFRQNANGMKLISRFWLGNGLPNIAKKLVANEEQAYEMAIHCYKEYTRLGQILPEIYNKYKDITIAST